MLKATEGNNTMHSKEFQENPINWQCEYTEFRMNSRTDSENTY